MKRYISIVLLVLFYQCLAIAAERHSPRKISSTPAMAWVSQDQLTKLLALETLMSALASPAENPLTLDELVIGLAKGYVEIASNTKQPTPRNVQTVLNMIPELSQDKPNVGMLTVALVKKAEPLPTAKQKAFDPQDGQLGLSVRKVMAKLKHQESISAEEALAIWQKYCDGLDQTRHRRTSSAKLPKRSTHSRAKSSFDLQAALANQTVHLV